MIQELLRHPLRY